MIDSRVRRSLVSGLALGVAAMAAPGAAQAGLLTNGGFEDGLNGWVFTGDGVNDTASLSSDTPSGVGSSAYLDINAGAGLPWLQQDVPASVGDELTLTVSVKELVPNNPDAWIAAQVWLLPPDLGSILSSAALFFTNPEWETQSATVTVPAGATVARVLFTPQNPGFGVGTGEYLIDDVSLVAIPEPAGLLLAAVAIAALPGRRRR
ncbi:hypothetical protein [Botrimarina sp.]|uniref:hypothetical protein n=1 Tax=Botrimarina sp. TaxID=2795802 RepID=UPI0032EF574C